MADEVDQPPFSLAAAQACEAELASEGVQFEVLPEIRDGSGCGSPRPLLLTAVGEVKIDPPAKLQCPLAQALSRWIAEVVIPSARLHLEGGGQLSVLGIAGSYQCRARSGSPGKGSEHASANAIDIARFGFNGRESVAVRDWTDPADGAMEFQAAVRGGACAYFTTVLGPGADADHADHLHVDLAKRTAGHRLCQ